MPSVSEHAYRLLTSGDDERVCRDIPEELCPEQPGNFTKHVVALTAQKTGDGLADPKLVLAWILTTLGSPAWQVGLLVPIREAGALVPQLVIAGWIRSRPIRKSVWAVATAGQGLAVAAMAVALTLLDGAVAGGAILGALLVFALFRSAASVSYKDVLGKTVSKATRGSATGSAASIASAMVLLFGLVVAAGWIPLQLGAIRWVLAGAAALWLLAAMVFRTLAEVPGTTAPDGSSLRIARDQLGLLLRDRALRRFILVRGLLLATALAPPWILALSGRSSPDRLGALGPFVIASAAASVSSGWIWGRLADRSSRKVLIAAAATSSVPLFVVAGLAIFGELGGGGAILPLLLFMLMVGYQGVRVGRSTHVVDMADEETRAAYVALSNTSIGLLLLLASVFGAIASLAGEGVLLGVFGVMCVGAGVAALGLDEVQSDAPRPTRRPARRGAPPSSSRSR